MDKLFGLDEPAPHDEGLSLLTTVYDNASLVLTVGILRDAGIPFLLKDRGAGGAMRVIAGYNMFGTDIFVREEDLDTAAALITPPDAEELTENDETLADGAENEQK